MVAWVLTVLCVVVELLFVPSLRFLLHSSKVILHSSDEVFEISCLAMALMLVIRPSLELVLIILCTRVTEAFLIIAVEFVVVAFTITVHCLSSSLLVHFLLISRLSLSIAESLEVLVGLLLLLPCKGIAGLLTWSLILI